MYTNLANLFYFFQKIWIHNTKTILNSKKSTLKKRMKLGKLRNIVTENRDHDSHATLDVEHVTRKQTLYCY